MRRLVIVLGLLGAAACSTAGHTYNDAASDSGCTLGSLDNCGTCGHVCPGMDNTGTQRTCSSATAMGTCNITCKGEFYDLDNDVSNGCEVEDQPIQDSTLLAVAINLPDVNNGGAGSTACNGATNPCTQVGQIYSDTRDHENAPVTRPLGREDWYKLVATGTGGPNKVGACLGITNFPTDTQYEVCIGNAGSATPTTCMAVQGGGNSVCVAPPTAADSGTFFIKLRKISGTNTTNKYALYVVH
ncbi:MAG TPA: hypothetical protein VLB44_09345 [Kofleriaceae bacterium]|nr:hypothetical protein [Kofleriaceae bacterium]